MFLFKSKDGGKDSNVIGYWLVEIKYLFSIVILCFNKGSRDAFHNHAFNAVSWIIKGKLEEHIKEEYTVRVEYMTSSLLPYFTPKERMHKVYGISDKTWVISFRGPWGNTWKEYLPNINKFITLTHGRKIL